MKKTSKYERTEKQLLPVRFTDDELQAIGLQLAATHNKIGEKKRTADTYKDSIDSAMAEATRLAMNRVNGWEMRYVDCQISFDFQRSTKRIVRTDTGEIVSEGPMSDDELKLAQMAFDDAARNDEQKELRP